MSAGKGLFQYALRFKKMIIVALVMLTISIAADLMGPFIAKTLIDEHILGIESKWYETTSKKHAVTFDGKRYKRESAFTSNEVKGPEARVFQVGKDFIFVKGNVRFEGDRSFENGKLTIRKGKQMESYDGKRLNRSELMSFYKSELPDMLNLIFVYFGILVVAAFFQYGQHYYLQKSANRIIQQMRQDLFAHIQTLSINYFDNLPAGKVVSRITNDTEAIRELYVTVLSTFFNGVIQITGIYIALFILDVKLAMICLILIPVLYVWMVLYRKYASKFNHAIRSRVSDLNGMINESIQGMNIIQAFGREKETEEAFEKLNQDHFKFQNKMLTLNGVTSFNLSHTLQNMVFVAFIWYFGSSALQENAVISLGLLYAFIDYINRLFQPVTGMVNQLANLEQALVAGERVFELLDKKGVSVSDKTIPEISGEIIFDHVFFGYKEDEFVLKNLNFTAKRGETIALVGHTGSGKSSIMNLLFRFYDCQKGQILIDGKNITDYPQQTIRKHMGIVLQDPFLFTGTIASNVSLDDPTISREKIKKALADVGADKVLKNLENGIDEPVVEKGSTLSSGQRQLISFARALAFDPAILILDEATSSVDTETELVIQNAMDVLKKGRTTFIIAHRLSTIRNADQIIVLEKGEIVEKGNHDELMSEQGRYYQMYQLQQGSTSLVG